MRCRFFTQDPRYIALQELTGEGKYRPERVSSESSTSPGTSTPNFTKRMSGAFSKRNSGLSFSSSTHWKRNSFNRAVTATKDVFGAIPRRRRNSDSDTEMVEKEPTNKKRTSFRESWAKGWMDLPITEVGGTFTIAHTTLFVPYA